MTVTRKIGFYALQLVNSNDPDDIIAPLGIREVIDYVQSITKPDRKREFDENKFYLLSEVSEFEHSNAIQTLIFTYAEHGHRPPLINKDTLEERDNPKVLAEGDSEKTHAALRYDDDEAILLLEEVKSGLTVSRLVYYLEQFADQLINSRGQVRNYKIRRSIIPKHDFLAELMSLRRVRVGYISMSKRLLGSKFLNLSDRIEEVEDDITIGVNARRNNSVKYFFEDIYNRFSASDSEITKIRVHGFNDDNRGIILDTEIIKTIEYLDLDTNLLTGEIDSQQFLRLLISILFNGESNAR